MRRVLLAIFALAFAGAGLLSAQGSDPTAKLVAQLKSKKAEKRTEALVALAELGPKAAPAIPALAAILPGWNEEERVLATMALGKIGKASLPAAAKLLDHDDETTRYYAIWTLALLGKDASEHAPRLLKTFETDDDPELRVKSAYALARIAPDSKDVFAAFARLAVKKNDVSAERQAAVEELRHFGLAALEPLTVALKDGIALTSAMESIHHVLNQNKNDASAKVVVPRLPDILAYSVLAVPFVQETEGLTYFLSKHGDKLLAILEAQMRDKDKDTANTAGFLILQVANDLSTKGENPELVARMVKLLMPHLTGPDANMRSTLLGGIPITNDSQAVLEKMMYAENPQDRFQAFFRLQGHGVEMGLKMQAKLKAAKGDDWLRVAAAHYSCTQDQELLRALSANLKHKDAELRHTIACALVSLNGIQLDAKQVKTDLVPALLDSLKSDKAERRLHASQALWNLVVMGPMHPYDKSHAPALLVGLDDPSPKVRGLILNVLQRIVDRDAKDIRKKALPLLEDADEDVRFAALVTLGPLSDDCVLEIARRAEKDDSQRIWEMACMHLTQTPKTGRPALPALLRAHQKPDRQSYMAAVLMEIAPDETFLPILEAQMKEDGRLRKAITQPKEIYENRHKLLAAVLTDLKDGDATRRAAAAYVLNTLSTFLPRGECAKLVKAVSPHLTEQLARLDKDLKSKDAKTRIAAATTLVDLKGLGSTLDMLVSNLAGDKGWEQLFKQQEVQHASFESLIRRARSDPELQVRRQGRKAETIGIPAGINLFPNVFPRVPLDGFNIPFGGGLRRFPFGGMPLP